MSFNRVATIYDATRAVPEEVVDRVRDRVVEATHADEGTRFLEIGIGTGRIALPFIRAGYEYAGVDIAHEMVAQLRAKVGNAPNLRLIDADVTDLPLQDGSFDVVLTVHVLHLVPEWRKALDEAQRVLTPHGFFVMGRNEPLEGDPGYDIRATWRRFVEARGVALRPTYGVWPAVDAELTRRGGRTSVYRVAKWAQEVRPSDLLEEQRNRVFSSSWDVPDDVLEAVDEQMRSWVTERYGSSDAPMASHEEFVVSVTCFDS